MSNALAQINLSPNGMGFKGFGPLGLEGHQVTESLGIFNNAISTAIGIMTIIGIIWFLVMFIGSTIAIIGSGGDKGKLEQARSRMFTAVIGLVILITALFLVSIFGNLIGIDILNVVNLVPKFPTQ